MRNQRPKPKRLPSGKYQVKFQQAGREYMRRFPSKKLAENMITECWVPWTCRKIGPGNYRQNYSLAGRIREFLNYQERIKLRARATIVNYSQMLKVFTRFCEEVIHIPEIENLTIDHFRQYQKWWFDNAPFNDRVRPLNRNNKGMATTWDMYRQTCHVFFAWAVQRGYCDSNVATGPEFKVTKTQRVPVTLGQSDITKILAHLDTEKASNGIPYKAIMVRLLLYTGLRISEAVNLKWSEVELEPLPLLRIRNTKTNTDRVVPIAAPLLPWLRRLPKAVYLFDGGDGRPLHHKKTYLTDLQRACEKTGCRKFRIHELRHSCARYLIEAGVDIVTVKNILGHSDIHTTEKYLRHFSLDLAKSGVDRLSFETGPKSPGNGTEMPHPETIKPKAAQSSAKMKRPVRASKRAI